MSVRAAIYGCAGTGITEGERHFFREAKPWGLRSLCPQHCRSRAGQAARRGTARGGGPRSGSADRPVKVAGSSALRRRTGAASRPRRCGELYEADVEQGLHAARLGAKLIAAELRHLGITVDCLPVLDVSCVPGAHDVIGDRAYADTPGPIAALGLAAAEGLLSGGVLPVIKPYSGSRPRRGRQPQEPARRRHAGGRTLPDRLRAVSCASPHAARHDRTCRLHGARSRPSGHHLSVDYRRRHSGRSGSTAC